jgi:hypothetical protein
MRGKSIVGAVLIGAVLMAAAVVALRALLGGSGPVVLGMVLGLGLGAGGAALEVVLMLRALETNPSSALNVVLGGLGVRLLVLVLMTVVFHWVPAVNETAFALAFVAGFVASLPAIAVVSGRLRGGDPRADHGANHGEVHG